MMPSIEELFSERVWNDQIVPRNLGMLSRRLRDHYNASVSQIGTIGDARHLRGYHRSRAWILQSKHCTSRTYSVSETIGNRHGGNDNWVSGIDLVLGRATSRTIYERLQHAKRLGRLPQIRQILLETNPWHVHLSIDRAHADDNHDQLFSLIVGRISPGGPMSTFSLTMPVLKEGMEGDDVRTAQGLLCARGHVVKIDGKFGPKTQHETRQMQIDYGAELIDGIWGPETWTIAVTRADRL